MDGGSRRSDTADRRINASQRPKVGEIPPFSLSEGRQQRDETEGTRRRARFGIPAATLCQAGAYIVQQGSPPP